MTTNSAELKQAFATWQKSDDYYNWNTTDQHAELNFTAGYQAGRTAAQGEDSEWRRLALQFDGHRMQAIWHLNALMADPVSHSKQVREFLSAGPLSGEEVLAQRIAAIAASHAGSAEQVSEREQEDAYVIDRMSNLLAGVAIALKGPEAPRHRHGYQDLPEVAQVLVLERDLLKAQLEEARAALSAPERKVTDAELPTLTDEQLLGTEVCGHVLEAYGYTAEQMREYALAALNQQGEQTAPDVLFDGYAVLQALSEKAKARTSPENVSDVLDAVVKLIRAAAPSTAQKDGGRE